jgi:serine/threonine protein phosphatase PrpC
MSPATNALRCPVCHALADPSHLGCEACGADLHRPASSQGHWLSSAAEERPCTECGRSQFDTLGYCQHCGHRRTTTSDRIELDLTTLGAATDFGKRHHYNQDALAIGKHESTSVAVICDGVSSSTFSELAALAAVESGVASILDALSDKNSLTEASRAGVTAAAEAAARAGTGLSENPPSCTYVSAVVDEAEIVVTWVGDSRAYWISDDHAVAVTVDDSHVGRLAAAGVPEDDERYRTPYATALLAWLGADAPPLQPHSISFKPDRPGLMLVCSDGLSGYLSGPADLLPLPHTSPVGIATAFTERARDFGGRDNISVIAVRFPSNVDEPETLAATTTARLGHGGS